EGLRPSRAAPHRPTGDPRRDDRGRPGGVVAPVRPARRGRHPAAEALRHEPARVDARLPARDPRADRRPARTAPADAGRVASGRMETLLDLLAEAVTANGDKTALSLRLDDGSTATWSYRELERRSRLGASPVWSTRGREM